MITMHPRDRLYTKSHEWVKLEDDIATVGITSYAVEQLGDITYVEVEPIGTKVKKGEPLGDIESSKTADKIYAPISGLIVEVNKDAGVSTSDEEGNEEGLEKISEDPYGEGWIVKIRVEDTAKEEIKDLMNAEQYEEFLKREAH